MPLRIEPDPLLAEIEALTARVSLLETFINTNVYKASVRKGAISINKVEEKALTAGPELVAPATGFYEVGISIRIHSTEAGLVEGQAGVSINNAVMISVLADYVMGQIFDLVMTTNYETLELKKGDKVTIHVKQFQAIAVSYDLARLSLLRLS